ncbi:MAG: hypothetical protein LBC92_02775 [Rickettsiales bacterium]|nr:hypothetical protein [Rickettsiales bacterium]
MKKKYSFLKVSVSDLKGLIPDLINEKDSKHELDKKTGIKLPKSKFKLSNIESSSYSNTENDENLKKEAKSVANTKFLPDFEEGSEVVKPSFMSKVRNAFKISFNPPTNKVKVFPKLK